VGKTERVFAIWREEVRVKAERDAPVQLPPAPADVVELERRLKAAEGAAAEHLKRAELAEYREQAHQEHWALEVDRLRQRLRAQETSELEVRRLQDRVLQLSRELMGYRP
jgi:small-conductance mechanosensitive channel